jgi:hypothetical protein
MSEKARRRADTGLFPCVYRGVWKSTCCFEVVMETILSGSITAVALTAAGLGAMHTLLGPGNGLVRAPSSSRF